MSQTCDGELVLCQLRKSDVVSQYTDCNGCDLRRLTASRVAERYIPCQNRRGEVRSFLGAALTNRSRSLQARTLRHPIAIRVNWFKMRWSV